MPIKKAIIGYAGIPPVYTEVSLSCPYCEKYQHFEVDYDPEYDSENTGINSEKNCKNCEKKFKIVVPYYEIEW